MLSGPIACFDDVVWFEPGINPAESLDGDNHNWTRPNIGEERHVCIRHGHQEPVGGLMWLLFQSGFSLANGFPESESELEAENELETALLIEVEILSQQPLPKKRNSWGGTQYNAEVCCLRVMTLADITRTVAPCIPFDPLLNWPDASKEVQIWETPSFTFVWLISESSTQWFVLTRTTPPRMIVACYIIELEDNPISVCNCELDWSKWPHRVHKTRR